MRQKKKTPHGRPSVGFTLVEMLVAVALVLLMMSLFAQVFQLAGGSITKQRGIAENDQRSRTFQNVIKADLDKRTFRLVMPWSVGEDGSLAEVDAPRREGYLYISENDPLNDLDDELQFTISVNALAKNIDTSSYFGKAVSNDSTGSIVGWEAINSSGNKYLTFANQPEADDGWSTPNGTAEAPAAEVAYFVRGGKLYRRILLVRKPLPLSGADSQPSFTYNGSTYDAFDNTPSVVPGASPIQPYPVGLSFWNDFDHSAYPQAGGGGAGPIARFHSVDDLSNASTLTNFPLGIPRWRFGHRTDLSGRPREFDSSNPVNYFGRFLHEETSDPNFRYPNGNSTVGNPMTVGLALDTTTNVFPDFVGGPRRGEDLLLSNVHAFDVKIWDPNVFGGAGAFVDIGRTAANADVYNPAAMDFSVNSPDNRSNTQYGPIPLPLPAGFVAPYNVNRVFDTWYPFVAGVQPPLSTNIKLDADGNDTNDPPPFRHVIYGAGATSGSYGVAVSQQMEWEPLKSYNAGDLRFPMQNATQQRKNGLRFVYRCVTAGTSAAVALQPTVTDWPAVAGGRFTDGSVIWEAVDNWKPLRAIQITVRFYDVTSDQMRQQTIVHSLID